MTLISLLSLWLLQASSTWLPPQASAGLAGQLAERLAGNPDRPPTNELLAAAATEVARLRAVLDGWGEGGVLERAPVFAELTLPSSGQRHLDAMARYQVCTMALALDLSAARTDAARRQAAIGMTAMTMAVLFLRQPYLARGNDPESIRTFMVDERMERAVAGLLSGQAAVRAHVDSKCGPLLASFGDDAAIR